MSSSRRHRFSFREIPLLITALIFSALLLPPSPVQPLPTFSLVDSTSRLFPYRTNFFQALRLKSRLARSPTRNVAAVLAAMAEEEAAAEASRVEEYDDGESSLTLYSLTDPMKKTTTSTTTETPEQIDGIEVEETPIEPPSSPVSQGAIQCGIPSSRMLNSLLIPGGRRGRIVGGEVVHHGEYPWMASLLLRGRHYCGAVIIDAQHLLTAGHCLHGHEASAFTALLGSVYSLSSTYTGRGIHSGLSGSSSSNSNNKNETTSNLPNDKDETEEAPSYSFAEGPTTKETTTNDASPSAGYENLVLVNVDRFIVHENFTRTDFFRNDIALVRLREKVAFNDFISPVCLPRVSISNQMKVFSDQKEENEIIQGVDGEKLVQRHQRNKNSQQQQIPFGFRSASPPLPVPASRAPAGSGTVVGWGAIEKYGDSAASRGFLRELNRKRLAAFSGQQGERGNSSVESNRSGNLSTAIKTADMEDVLRLRKVELPFIDRQTCERWYGSRGRPIRLIDAQFCAGLYEGGKDACRGDSGGPIMQQVSPLNEGEEDGLKPQYAVVGIVSAGIGCALPKLPGIYTKVESYLDWIQEHLLASSSAPEVAALLETRDSAVDDNVQVQPALSFGSSGSSYEYDEAGWQR